MVYLCLVMLFIYLYNKTESIVRITIIVIKFFFFLFQVCFNALPLFEKTFHRVITYFNLILNEPGYYNSNRLSEKRHKLIGKIRTKANL